MNSLGVESTFQNLMCIMTCDPFRFITGDLGSQFERLKLRTCLIMLLEDLRVCLLNSICGMTCWLAKHFMFCLSTHEAHICILQRTGL